jgi:hypothetical protein
MARIELIAFGIDGGQVLRTFDVDRVRIGGVVHATLVEGEVQLAPDPSTGSKPYKIVHVTRILDEGCRMVSLLNAMFFNDRLGERILAAVGERLAPEDVDHRILVAAAAADVPFERLHDRDVIANSRIRRIESVLDRLDLIDILGSKDTGGLLWMHYWGIVSYLLLTCFDLLGQDRGWLEPGAWLRSIDERHTVERAEALAQCPSTDHVAAALALLAAHSRIYGVHRAFRRFIDQVLPIDARTELLACIAIEQWPTPPQEGDLLEVVDEKKKMDWLFELRNAYTHRALYVPGTHTDSMPVEYRDDEALWVTRERMTPAKTTLYAVKRWPKALGEAVRAGLAQYVRRLKE